MKTKIYRVDMINHDSNLTTSELINPVEIDTVEDGDCVLSTLGATQPKEKQYWQMDPMENGPNKRQS